MLTKAVGSDAVSTHLQGSKPSPIQFHNHKSVQTYAAFVDTELVKALAKGVIAEWPFPDPPTVVNGLKVVDDKIPKLKLCINPMCINKGVYYCFKVLPFGVSIACWIYSIIKQELYRPARIQGARLQYLIDDR